MAAVFANRTPGRLWLGPSGRLLLALTAVTLASVGSLSWVGWEMLRQDADVEAQRAQERLDYRADLAVQSLERQLTAIEDRLAAWTATPSSGPPPDPTVGGLVAVFTPVTIEPSPSSRLLFYPNVPRRAEPPADLFVDGERAEFQQGDLARAAQIFRRLADSEDKTVRAAALMRLGRTLRAAGRPSEALAVYARMVVLEDVSVVGLPADLVARSATMQVLSDTGAREAAQKEARLLSDDLAQGRWRLTRGQYEYYAGAARAVSGVARTESINLAAAHATADLWESWKNGLPPNGRRSFRISDVPLLAVWRGGQDRLAVWIVPPEELLTRSASDARTAVALSDGDGSTVAGALDGSGRSATRTPADTRLPWTVHAQAVPDDSRQPGLTRGRLIALGLGTMVTFLVAGLYFIGRAVRQEMDLAHLQSDFVSAVSHEFRTPLAAMRQLSELLVADRVSGAERRQQYYESLAGESRRLQHLVENLLDFGRLQAGTRPYRLEPLDPRALVEQVVGEFRSELVNPTCQIEVEGGSEPVRVLADANAVGLALHNLLDNAMKYAGPSSCVAVSLTREGDRVALRVRDNGPGIPADERTRIFERFVRGTAAAVSNVRGTGIGLALVRQVVLSHGGDVTVESAPGAGSIFTIWLPIPAEVGS
jgi:signal transduction histidine kinase